MHLCPTPLTSDPDAYPLSTPLIPPSTPGAMQVGGGASLTVGDDVDGFIMEVEEAHETAPRGQEGSVARLDVGVELQVLGQVLAFEQRLSGPQV